MADKWIQGAIKYPGALTAKAKAAGVSLSQFMQEKHKDSTTSTAKSRWPGRRVKMARNHKGKGKK